MLNFYYKNLNLYFTIKPFILSVQLLLPYTIKSFIGIVIRNTLIKKRQKAKSRAAQKKDQEGLLILKVYTHESLLFYRKISFWIFIIKGQQKVKRYFYYTLGSECRLLLFGVCLLVKCVARRRMIRLLLYLQVRHYINPCLLSMHV